MKSLAAITIAASVCLGCSTSSPAYTTVPDSGASDGGAVFDAGPSYIDPGEVPDEHYPDGFACPTASAPDGGGSACDDPVATDCCHKDADCTHGYSGHCNVDDARHIGICFYADQCRATADCRGGTCVCGKSTAPGNQCVSSECRLDSECGEGGFCSPSRTICSGTARVAAGVYCHTAQDRCLNDRDCPDDGTCGFVPERAMWMCIEKVLCVFAG